MNMLVIGITGGTGSGKTTIVNQILNKLQSDRVSIISQDSYYKDISHLNDEDRVKINFDHPNSVDFELLVHHLKNLRQQQTIHQPVYSFVKHNQTNDTILTHSRKVIIVEGILIFTSSELRDLLDIKIFVHTDNDERLIRPIKRDIKERRRDLDEVLTRYQNTLKPMHQKFIELTKKYADIIIPNNIHNTVTINVVKAIINEKLNA